MKNLLKSVFVISIILSSCKSPIENNGPKICPSSKFVFEQQDLKLNALVYNETSEKLVSTEVADGSSIDFSSGGLNIYAELDEAINWEVLINSKTSSASYSFSGNSKVIDLNWFGQTNELPFFGAEAVEVKLLIACKNPLIYNFTISSRPNFKHVAKDFGLLLRDWDKNGYYPVAGNTPQNGPDGWQGDLNVTFTHDSLNPAYSGSGKYFSLYRQSENKLWYFGATTFDLININTLLSTNDPDSLYLNVFLKGDFYENTGIEFGINKSGANYMKTGTLDWNGWKMVSVKLSDLMVTFGSSAGEKLSSLGSNMQFVLSLGANPEQADELKVSYDFVFLSVGKPLFE